MDEQQKLVAAKNHVSKLRRFYKNLCFYVIVNIVLIIINFTITPNQLWFYWATIFWGLGIAIHAFSLFGTQGKMLKNWEQKKIKEYMDKN